MARIVDPITGGLSFECREDLSPEFDIARPNGFKWGFELPSDVDFIIACIVHHKPTDFEPLKDYISVADLYLRESIDEDDVERILFELISDHNPLALNELKRRLKLVSLIKGYETGFHIAEAEAIYEHRLLTRVLDPPSSNPIYKGVWTDTLELLESSIDVKLDRARDNWALHNLKKVIDDALPPDEWAGRRRKVLIARGFMHLGLLRALEWQTEYNPKKSNGSLVVASTVVIPDPIYRVSQTNFENACGAKSD